MKYMFIYLATIITSIGMEFINELRYFKELGDLNLKVDLEKIENIKNEFNINDSKLSYLIPFINMLIVLHNTYNYDEKKKNFYLFLNTFHLIVPMTLEEIKEYQNKPTGLTAYKISKRNNKIENNNYHEYEVELNNYDKSINQNKIEELKELKRYLLGINNDNYIDTFNKEKVKAKIIDC